MWITQQKDGFIKKHPTKPFIDPISTDSWNCENVAWESVQALCRHKNLPMLKINLDKHDYKIEDGILIKVEKTPKVIMGRDLQVKNIYGEWRDCESYYEFRIKPKTKIVKYRIFLHKDGYPQVAANENITERVIFVKWLGDWQEVEVPIEA